MKTKETINFEKDTEYIKLKEKIDYIEIPYVYVYEIKKDNTFQKTKTIYNTLLFLNPDTPKTLIKRYMFNLLKVNYGNDTELKHLLNNVCNYSLDKKYIFKTKRIIFFNKDFIIKKYNFNKKDYIKYVRQTLININRKEKVKDNLDKIISYCNKKNTNTIDIRTLNNLLNYKSIRQSKRYILLLKDKGINVINNNTKQNRVIELIEKNPKVINKSYKEIIEYIDFNIKIRLSLNTLKKYLNIINNKQIEIEKIDMTETIDDIFNDYIDVKEIEKEIDNDYILDDLLNNFNKDKLTEIYNQYK